jgi:hypothetical protein
MQSTAKRDPATQVASVTKAVATVAKEMELLACLDDDE